MIGRRSPTLVTGSLVVTITFFKMAAFKMDSYHDTTILGNLGRIACSKEEKKYEKYLSENL